MVGEYDQDWTHMHTHSDASRIDGLGTVHRLVTGAASLGFKRLGLTDHGSLANAIAFSASCKAVGIKPLLGLEAYVGLGGKRYHLTLLADGNEGFNTLVALNNLGQAGDDKTRPTFDLWALQRHNAGLVVLTGCPASPMQELDWVDAKDVALGLKSILGPRLMAEVMLVSSHGQPWERAGKLARDCGLAPVLTNDAHFPFAGDAAIHTILVQLKAAFSYDSSSLFLATAEELRERQQTMAPSFSNLFESALANAARLSGKLGEVTFTATPKLPTFQDADGQLELLARTALNDYYGAGKINDMMPYIARLEDELGVVADMGFASYFLILKDIVDFAKANHIRVGPGRGSGAGSLILYLLNISEMDPIAYGLSFDRFLNRKRAEMPDVDVDFESQRRQEVLDYAASRWGAMPVATYARWNHKSLVHDLSRQFHIPREFDDAAAEAGEGSKEFKRLVERYDRFGDAYQVLNGQIRHIGQHAGGVVIVDEHTAVPLERIANGDLVAGWTEGEHRELTMAGITKFDLLGLTALSTLRLLEDKHGRRAPDPVDDDPVFELFRQGDLHGIFQFAGSQGILQFTKDVAPRTFGDLVAINALYRPGALDSGAAKRYPEWRLNPRSLHPLLDPILAETYGVICYQEQFMAIFAVMTNQTMAEADLARKVLAKARPGQPDWEEKFARLQVEFFDGAKAHGLDAAKTQEVWGEVVTHTRYSFNKSHSVAYARIAWDMAWWKYHHQVDFYAATLTTDPTEWQPMLFEVVASGIEVKPPHVNTSTRNFESDGQAIYLPFNVVKYLAEGGQEAILQAQPFKSVADFAARVPRKKVNQRALQGLWEIGAFAGLPGTSKDLKVTPRTYVNDKERQEACIGMFLPDPEFMAAVASAETQGFSAGIVAKSEERTKSRFGPYIVYVLLPAGAFWSRGLPKLPVGAEVKLDIKRENGKILHVYPLR